MIQSGSYILWSYIIWSSNLWSYIFVLCSWSYALTSYLDLDLIPWPWPHTLASSSFSWWNIRSFSLLSSWLLSCSRFNVSTFLISSACWAALSILIWKAYGKHIISHHLHQPPQRHCCSGWHHHPTPPHPTTTRIIIIIIITIATSNNIQC